MSDQQAALPSVAIKPASNGIAVAKTVRLESPPAMEPWVCDGRDKRGHVCGRILMEMAIELECGRVRVRVRCHKCGTFHTREVSS